MKTFVAFLQLAVAAIVVGLQARDGEIIYKSAQERPDEPQRFPSNGDCNQERQLPGFWKSRGSRQGREPGVQPRGSQDGPWSRPGFQPGSEMMPFSPALPNNGDGNQGRQPDVGWSLPPRFRQIGEGNQGRQRGFGGQLPPGFPGNARNGPEGDQGFRRQPPPAFPNNGGNGQEGQRGFRQRSLPGLEADEGDQGRPASQGRPEPDFMRGGWRGEAPGFGTRQFRGSESDDDSSEERPRLRRPQRPPRDSGSASSEEDAPWPGIRPIALLRSILGDNWPLNGTQTFTIATPEMPAIRGNPDSQRSETPGILLS